MPFISKVVDLLPDYFIASFTCAVSYHVFTSQLFHVFGIEKVVENGLFSFFKYWVQIIKNIKQTNPISITISAIAIPFLILAKFISAKYKWGS